MTKNGSCKDIFPGGGGEQALNCDFFQQNLKTIFLILFFLEEFQNILIIHVVLVVALIVVGSIIFWQEEGWTYAQSLHFSFVTMSTVGYGDIAPTKPGTKIFCMFYIIFGVGLLVRLGGLVNKSTLFGKQIFLSPLPK